jgi:hypothetical protein
MVQGFLESLFSRLNLNLEVPCYTQMSRRPVSLTVPLRKLPPKGALDIVVDTTGASDQRGGAKQAEGSEAKATGTSR